jgi:hypothetical protein
VSRDTADVILGIPRKCLRACLSFSRHRLNLEKENEKEKKMSAEAQPITLSAFADAIKALPLSAIYGKVFELRNSVAHLRRSNAELRLYIASSTVASLSDGVEKTGEDGVTPTAGTASTAADDQELETYIHDNEGVIAAMTERITLCRAEIENRGERWIELDDDNNDTTNNNLNHGDEDDAGGIAGADTGHIVNGLPEATTTALNRAASARTSSVAAVPGNSVGATIARDPHRQQDLELDEDEGDQGVFL